MPEPCLGFHNLPARRGKASFPTIGKSFPMVGKFRPFFPMIGKFFGPFLENKKNKIDNKTTGGQNRQTIPTIPTIV
jgi:hypothetical protein